MSLILKHVSGIIGKNCDHNIPVSLCAVCLAKHIIAIRSEGITDGVRMARGLPSGSQIVELEQELGCGVEYIRKELEELQNRFCNNITIINTADGKEST